MLASAETINFQADLAVAENIPARVAQPFDIGATAMRPAIEVHPYEGPGLAEASNTKQACLSKLERPPYDVTSVMDKPSRAEVFTKASYSGVKGCDSWQRLGKYRVQIKQNGHWLGIEGNFWYPTDEDIADKNDAHKVALLAFSTRGVQEKRVHGHWEPARVQFRNSVRSDNTDKIVATGKIKNHPVKIEG